MRDALPEPPETRVALAFGASVIYGIFVLIAVFWFWVREQQHRLPQLAVGEHGIFASLAVGVAVGLLISGTIRLLARYVQAFARLEAQLTEVVGDLSESEIVVIAMASAIGEEMLFRGAMQDQFNLYVSALVFGLLHTGPGLWLWTCVAALLGLLFGAMVHFEFGLLSVTVAHALINFTSLRRMTAA